MEFAGTRLSVLDLLVVREKIGVDFQKKDVYASHSFQGERYERTDSS